MVANYATLGLAAKAFPAAPSHCGSIPEPVLLQICAAEHRGYKPVLDQTSMSNRIETSLTDLAEMKFFTTG